MYGFVSDLNQCVLNGTGRRVWAFTARLVKPVRGAGEECYGPLYHAKNVCKRDLIRGQGKLVATVASGFRMKQFGLAELSEDLLEKSARTVREFSQSGRRKAFARLLRHTVQGVQGVNALAV